MSLFDVIKYPVSLDMSFDNFVDLPEDIKSIYITRFREEGVTDWPNDEWPWQHPKNLEILKKVIEEY